MVLPMSAPNTPMAKSGPGCGGTRPCTTDRPANSGMPMRISDTPVRRATMNTSGISSTKPISKNSGMPTRKAANIIAQCTRSLPKASISVRAMRSAPPDSAIILPSMVPRPSTMPTKPSTPPKPSWKDFITRSTGMPEVRPRKPAARVSAMRCTRQRVIRRMSPRIATRASTSRNTSLLIPNMSVS